MSRTGKHGWAGWPSAIIFIGIVAAATASLLPLIDTDTWWIRFLDFPRLQLSVILLGLLALFFLVRRRLGGGGVAALLIAGATLAYHGSKLHPYSGFTGEALAAAGECGPEDSLRVMVANVLKKNEQAEPFLQTVAAAEPDLLLVMETDEWWDRHLGALDATYPERAQHVPEDHGAFGMHVFSRLPLDAPEFLFWFDNFTPTLSTGVTTRGGRTVRFLGLHPQPPHWSQPSTMRDGHIMRAALEAREVDQPVVVAGDFNAVPWEEVARRAARIGGLIDPRIGRGYHATFSADSMLMWWPLDQVLFQEEIRLMEFEVLPSFGSDHLPVVADLCLSRDDPAAAAPTPEPGDLEEARETLIKAEAQAKSETR